VNSIDLAAIVMLVSASSLKTSLARYKILGFHCETKQYYTWNRKKIKPTHKRFTGPALTPCSPSRM